MAMASDTKIFKPWKYGEGFETYTKQGSNSGTTPTLNGTWSETKPNPETGITKYYIFNNGNFVEGEDSMDFRRGTYTTATGSNNRMKITMTTTEDYYGQSVADWYNTTAGWKNKSQLIEMWRQYGFSDVDINRYLVEFGFNGVDKYYWIENRGGSVILTIGIDTYYDEYKRQ